MHLAKMWNQDGHLLRDGTTREEPASNVRAKKCLLVYSMLYLGDLYRKPSASVDDLEGEEEFYYTEIEVPLHHHDFAVLLSQGNGGQVAANAVRINKQPHHVKSLFSTSAPANVTAILQNLPSNLADHMDMARPPHENPEYNFAQNSIGGTVAVGAGSQASNTAFTAVNPRPAHHQPRRSYPPPPPAFSSITAAVPIAIPVTNLSFARSAVRKCIGYFEDVS